MTDPFLLSGLNVPFKIFEKKPSVAAVQSLTCLRLKNVTGYNSRKNDVIYWRPDMELCANSVVVFFGGDVQNFLENMKKNVNSQEYLHWSLENTSQLMHKCFPDKHVIVVRPYRMDFNIYSRYENFVPVTKYGTPKHTPMYNALQHLEALLKNVSRIIKESYIKKGEAFPELQNCDIVLIGFSKGCVVLNQFLYEFHYIKTLPQYNKSLSSIISRIKCMYWLDGGHSGGKNTWITYRNILETLANLEIKIRVHVTPYQVCDSERPWIASEEQKFSCLLNEMNADIERVFHFENRTINIAMHFELLNVFMQTSQTYETPTVQ